MKIDIHITDDGTESGADEALDTAVMLHELADDVFVGVTVDIQVHTAGDEPVVVALSAVKAMLEMLAE